MTGNAQNLPQNSARWLAIGGGAYEEQTGDGVATGRYRVRVEINHRRTWRKLKATGRRAAIKEANAQDWLANADTLAELAKQWASAGYPGRKGPPKSDRQAKLALPWLLKYFGKFRSDEIRLKHLPDYAAWRRRHTKRGGGGRTVDLDLAALSNLLHYGVKQGVLDINFIYRARDRFQGRARPAYEVMPASAEVIHQIAAEFFGTVKSEVMGWLALFSEFTGNRHSELLRLDLNSRNPNEPGYIQWFNEAECQARTDGLIGQLHLGERSKGGVNPWCDIGPEFGEMIRVFLAWQKSRHPDRGQKHRWFFPNCQGDLIAANSFNHALYRAVKDLELPLITPHGFRAYFATKQMRDGKRPVEIAYDMGDRTVSLIEKTYVGNIKGPKLWWVPADGLPAWQNWLNNLDYKRTTEAKRVSPEVTKPA